MNEFNFSGVGGNFWQELRGYDKAITSAFVSPIFGALQKLHSYQVYNGKNAYYRTGYSKAIGALSGMLNCLLNNDYLSSKSKINRVFTHDPGTVIVRSAELKAHTDAYNHTQTVLSQLDDISECIIKSCSGIAPLLDHKAIYSAFLCRVIPLLVKREYIPVRKMTLDFISVISSINEE